MNNYDRINLLSKLQGQKIRIGDGSDITALDYLILNDHKCEHEYGIRHKNGCEELCNCLDCGDALEEIHYKSEIYDISNDMDFRSVRQDYLNFLLKNSSVESVSMLSGEGKIKLSRKIVRIRPR